VDPLLDRLAVAVPAARTLEELSRPLLEMLGGVSGLESTYLTSIDLDANVQRVQFARNAGALTIPEGLAVPWADTLCKRSLDEGRPYTDAVASCWGDCEAARALGLQTYVSAPIRADDGTLLGTLCGASAERRPLTPDAQALLALFARLIGDFVERERLVERLRAANATLAAHAMSDPLTGLPNRRALVDELQRLLARARRERGRVLVVDLDGFKVGPIFRYRFPRYEWDGPGLYGTGFVPFTIEGGGFLRYDQRYVSAKVEVRRGLGGSNGLIFDALLDGKARLADNFFLSAGPRLAVTDGTYNQAYFGINATQSLMSGYQQYYPGAGLKSVGIGTSAVWRIDEKITGVAFGAWNRLVDQAAGSPLVTGPAGSPNQFIVGAALTWRFSW